MKKKNISIVIGDINNSDRISYILNKCRPDIIINCAAAGVDPTLTKASNLFKVNASAAVDLMEAASLNGVGRFVQLGSCFEYGNHTGQINESMTINPSTLYASSKAAASIVLPLLAKQKKIEYVLLRPFGVWGPNEADHRVVPQLCRALLRGQVLKMTPCEQLRDYTYVSDLVAWIAQISCLEVFPDCSVINLGSSGVRLKDFLLEIASYIGDPSLLQFGEVPYRENEMMSLVADTTALNNIIGPRALTPTKEGANEVLDWLRSCA